MGAFKGWMNTDKNQLFAGFPSIDFPITNPVFGFKGCINLWEAPYGLNTGTDAALIEFWNSRIGTNNFIKNTDATRPFLTLNAPGFNNKPAVDFGGPARYLKMTAGSSIPFSKNATILVAYQINVMGGTQNNLFSVNLSQATAFRLSLGGGSAGYNGLGFYTGNGSTPISQLSSGVWDLLPHVAVLTSTDIVVDGVHLAAGGTFDPVGYNSIGGGSFQSCNALIPIIAIYNRKFSVADMILLCNNVIF